MGKKNPKREDELITEYTDSPIKIDGETEEELLEEMTEEALLEEEARKKKKKKKNQKNQK